MTRYWIDFLLLFNAPPNYSLRSLLTSAKCRRNIISWVLPRENSFCGDLRGQCRTIMSSFCWNRHQLPASKRFNRLILHLFAWLRQRNQSRRLCRILVLPVPSTLISTRRNLSRARFRAEVVQSNTAWSGIAEEHEIQVTLRRFFFEASSRI